MGNVCRSQGCGKSDGEFICDVYSSMKREFCLIILAKYFQVPVEKFSPKKRKIYDIFQLKFQQIFLQSCKIRFI